VRYRVKCSKLVAVVVVVVMLAVGSFSSTAHAWSPWDNYWEFAQLVVYQDIPGMYAWVDRELARGVTDFALG
jgi:hypothetical protein